MRLFITGVTGFVGQAFLLELLRRNPADTEVLVLIRGKRQKTAEQRFADISSRHEALFAAARNVSVQLVDSDLLVCAQRILPA